MKTGSVGPSDATVRDAGHTEIRYLSCGNPLQSRNNRYYPLSNQSQAACPVAYGVDDVCGFTGCSLSAACFATCSGVHHLRKSVTQRRREPAFVIPPGFTKVRLLYYPDPVLQRRCAPVTDFGDRLGLLCEHMIQMMREANGVGLAAPQVGIPMRLFVCNPSGEAGEDQVFVNPLLFDLEEHSEAEEGCLSLPGVIVNMRRASKVVITAQSPTGAPLQVRGDGLHARVWQHENDHLDGKLIIDNMSSTDEIANRRALKQLRTGQG